MRINSGFALVLDSIPGSPPGGVLTGGVFA